MITIRENIYGFTEVIDTNTNEVYLFDDIIDIYNKIKND